MQLHTNHIALHYTNDHSIMQGRGAEYRDERVCLSVCVSVHISGTTRPTFTKFSAHVTCGCGSVSLSRRCDMLRTSGFIHDVILARNGPAIWKHVDTVAASDVTASSRAG